MFHNLGDWLLCLLYSCFICLSLLEFVLVCLPLVTMNCPTASDYFISRLNELFSGFYISGLFVLLP